MKNISTFILIAVLAFITLPSSPTSAGTPHWKPDSYEKVTYHEKKRNNKPYKITYRDVTLRLTNRRPYCGTDLRSPIPLSQERGILWVSRRQAVKESSLRLNASATDGREETNLICSAGW